MNIKFGGFAFQCGPIEIDINKEELKIIAETIVAFAPGPGRTAREIAYAANMTKKFMENQNKASA